MGQDPPPVKLRIGIAISLAIAMVVIFAVVPVFGIEGNFVASAAAPLGFASLVCAIGIGVADRRTNYFGSWVRMVLLVVGLVAAVVGLTMSLILR